MTTQSKITQLRKQFTDEQLQEVKNCRDEIRGLVWQDRELGYSDDEIEETMGDYLDEVYESYQQSAYVNYDLSENDFERIYRVLESIDGIVSF